MTWRAVWGGRLTSSDGEDDGSHRINREYCKGEGGSGYTYRAEREGKADSGGAGLISLVKRRISSRIVEIGST